MRKIIKIARLELSILFYSPVAWLVLTIFMIQSGIIFLDILQNLRTGLSLGYSTKPITESLFAGNNGLFTAMQGYIYLYIPILTMSLMSRETSSGSIKLLLSSPVKLREIILGKYFAIAAYGFTLIGVLGIFAIIGSLFIKNADIGLILSGLLALFLLICTYSAIGLFMSCLTNYQVVAAISTMAIFAILRYVGQIGQDVDIVRDLTYFLSISGRAEKMVNGMITTKDIFYYFIIIASFLMLCIFRLKAERELKPRSVKIGRYVALICVALFLGYLSARPSLTGYLDTTSQKSLTITKNSQDIAAKINGRLKVTTYVNMLAPSLWYVLPQSRNSDLSRMESFKRFIPGMEMEYVYYYKKPVDSNYRDYKYNPNLRGVTNIDDIAEKMSSTMGIDKDIFMPPTTIDKQTNLASEGNLLVRKLEFNGKSSYLRFFMGQSDPYATEAEISAALKQLIVKVPKVVFAIGNRERNTTSAADRNYKLISMLKTRVNALINQGFKVDTVDLNIQEIPDDADVLVLGDPINPYSTAAQQKITSYINHGGNMLITGEPGRQDVINPILQQLGVKLKSGILVTPAKNVTPGFISSLVAPEATKIDSNISRMQRLGVPVTVQGAAAVEVESSGVFKIKPLLVSADGGWNKLFNKNAMAQTESKEIKSMDRIGSVAAASVGAVSVAPASGIANTNNAPLAKLGSIDLETADLSFNASTGDQKGAFPIAVALSREINGKEQKIVVSGDADFVSNGELANSRSAFNEYYLKGIFRWFSDNRFPVDVSRPDAKDRDLKITRGQITGLMWLCKAAIPTIIALFGAIVLFKRRSN